MKNKSDKELFSNLFKNAQQTYNDQKLEMYTYSSTWKFGCFKVTKSDAEKVYHGEGPMMIKFKDTPPRVIETF